MKVIDLDGNYINWQIKGTEVTLDKRARSSLHLDARRVIKNQFPTQQLLEEVSIPIRGRKKLFLDFYLPLRKIAIEVHGEQHFKRVAHFHASAQDFIRQKKNDTDKQEWCESNGLKFLVLAYNNQDEWPSILEI